MAGVRRRRGTQRRRTSGLRLAPLPRTIDVDRAPARLPERRRTDQVLVLERRPDGALRVTSPVLPGWACSPRQPREILQCLDAGWSELQIAAYAARRGEVYDLAHHAEPAQPAAPAGRRYPERYDPAQWTPLPGGQWRSPSGRTYRGDASIVERVVAKRASMGLPVQAPDVEEAG